MIDNNAPNLAPKRDAIEQVSCITCGYDLRGQSIEDKCPECGAPVEQSLRGDLLQYADPSWLRTIARGAALVKWGVWLVVAYIPLVIAVAIVFGLVLAGRVSVVYENAATYFALGVLVIGLLLGGAGAFLSTTVDPKTASQESGLSTRLLTRLGVTAVALVASLQGALMAIPSIASIQIIKSAGLVCVAIFIAYACAMMFRWFGSLARRLPDPELEKRFRKHFRYVVWCVPALGIAQVLKPAGGMAITSGGAVTIAAGILLLIAGFALIALMAELSRTMSRFSRKLQDCAKPLQV